MSAGITKHFTHLGEPVTFRSLVQRYCLSYNVIWKRYRVGDRGERLVRPLEAKFGRRMPPDWNVGNK